MICYNVQLSIIFLKNACNLGHSSEHSIYLGVKDFQDFDTDAIRAVDDTGEDHDHDNHKPKVDETGKLTVANGNDKSKFSSSI